MGDFGASHSTLLGDGSWLLYALCTQLVSEEGLDEMSLRIKLVASRRHVLSHVYDHMQVKQL